MLTGKEKKYEKMQRWHVVIFNAGVLKTSKSPIFIFEGELDCLSIIEVGGEALGLGSTVNAKRLREILSKEPPSQPFILALDNDEAGQAATEKMIFGLEQLKFSFSRSKTPEGYKNVNEYLMKDREGKEIPTGFSELDKILDGGLYPGLYVIGAISSLGKTTLALQIADQIAQSGRGVLIFSLEMSRNELIAKSLSRLTFKADMEKNGKYGKNIHISEGIGNIGVPETVEKVREYIKFNDGESPIVVIDHLQTLDPTDMRATDKQNTDKAVLELKRLSRDCEVPVTAVRFRKNFSRICRCIEK